MTNALIQTIISEDNTLRNRSISSLLQGRTTDELLRFAEELESFRKTSQNLYHKVRAALFLAYIYGYCLQYDKNIPEHGTILFDGITAAFERNFERSIQIYLERMRNGTSQALCSALAQSYHKLSFQYLLDQVKQSISNCKENFLLYNIIGIDDYPYTVPEELTTPDTATGLYPVGMDASPVRLDPSHSGWSDIFFLGMDFPEGARVINLSVNLRIQGSSDPLLPPCECYCRYIEEPVILLRSTDLKASKKVSGLRELFNFGNDYLSLLKAAVVASGIVPPCFENKNIALEDILCRLLGKPGGFEVVTKVNNIPKGSRLAVSTSLLATIITRLMRFSGQIPHQSGALGEEVRRTVASRAILGEWLGGSGGGWQDSGGLWPGIKVISGTFSKQGDPEFGVSRGCLMPEHTVFSKADIPEEIEKKICDSMVLVHGGISRDVGPILEMVTEKYLLKHEREWDARIRGIDLFDHIVDALMKGDMKLLGRLTTEDWEEALQKVIPWVHNSFTEDLINCVKKEFGKDYWGFLMLGGMSGGGMAFIVDPMIRKLFKTRITEVMLELKQRYNASLPFIIDPVVYDFEINHDGIVARLLKSRDAKIPEIFDSISSSKKMDEFLTEDKIKQSYGFDSHSHEHMKMLLKSGKIGLAQNRLPESTVIGDVAYDDIFHFEEDISNSVIPVKTGILKKNWIPGQARNDTTETCSAQKSDKRFYETGITALRNNEAAVVTFAGGMGSRWTQGAAVVKPINPFIWMDGAFRTFMEIHLAKSKKTGKVSGHKIPHVFTTSYLTHDAIETYLREFSFFNYEALYLSPGLSIGRRVYPMERDLRFYREDQLSQKMDTNAQKIQEDLHRALIAWTKEKGEGGDYSDNKPVMRFNPPGHWFEIPNLIKNGTLAKMLKDHPRLKYMLCHNIDTLGVNLEPYLLGLHISSRSCITFEVTPRRIEDTGGGLALVNGKIRLVEGMALPREDDEYRLSFYNTNTNWITIDSLLDYFSLNRSILLDAESNQGSRERIIDALRHVEKKMPAYVTIKDVKYVWGSGQEDVYPVAQFEKLWGDMTGLGDLKTGYVSVSRYRGQQLKEPALLDRWANDGSFEYVKDKCVF
ncbi:MAG: UTP--glucose-1-phosphate uridylyltransferase [Nitrospiraceae bacterium]|nr:MAG: UTP--glucose-1-phosphate uridylyltransferase [Nitrospiraceae bacterium]